MLGPLQTLWVEALESGKYLQSDQGLLKTLGGKYCCLGVAREVIPDCYSNSHYFLDQYEVLKLFSRGGKLMKPVHKGGCEFDDLTDMNDGKTPVDEKGNPTGPKVSFTFAEIAAYIRANPENVFAGAV